MRIGPAGARRSYTNNGVPRWTHKISTDIRQKLPPFLQGSKCRNFWPKFRPRSSSDRRIFEVRHFIGKQKQTCQGSMIDLPPYQTWDGWVPPTPRTVGAMGTPKSKSGEFLIYPPFQRLTHSRRPPILHQQWGTGAPGWTHKISTDIPPMFPLFIGGNMSQILAQISTPVVFGPPYFWTGALHRKTKTNLSWTDDRSTTTPNLG